MASSESIGRIIGKDSKGYFVVRVDHRVAPEFGELWVVGDENRRYFARVVDIVYAADPTDISDYAKTLLDNPEMSIEDIDREYFGYNFALIDLLGLIGTGAIRDFYQIPSILSEVRSPDDDEYALVVQ